MGSLGYAFRQIAKQTAAEFDAQRRAVEAETARRLREAQGDLAQKRAELARKANDARASAGQGLQRMAQVGGRALEAAGRAQVAQAQVQQQAAGAVMQGVGALAREAPSAAAGAAVALGRGVQKPFEWAHTQMDAAGRRNGDAIARMRAPLERATAAAADLRAHAPDAPERYEALYERVGADGQAGYRLPTPDVQAQVLEDAIRLRTMNPILRYPAFVTSVTQTLDGWPWPSQYDLKKRGDHGRNLVIGQDDDGRPVKRPVYDSGGNYFPAELAYLGGVPGFPEVSKWIDDKEGDIRRRLPTALGGNPSHREDPMDQADMRLAIQDADALLRTGRQPDIRWALKTGAPIKR